MTRTTTTNTNDMIMGLFSKRRPISEKRPAVEDKQGKDSKTKVFNIVILDRSGSMSQIRMAAVEGFNETLAGIRNAQEKYADTQEHFVSLITFCGCRTDKVFDMTTVGKTHPLTMSEYQPCCTTPLYDAIGSTLSSMREHVKSEKDALAVVTIISDGLENASRTWTGTQVLSLIEALQNEGWTFNYMGANQDSMKEAMKMSIRHARNFEFSDKGMRNGMYKDIAYRERLYERMDSYKRQLLEQERADREHMKEDYAKMADEAFYEDKDDDGRYLNRTD